MTSLLGWICVFLSLYLVIFMHELGHLVAILYFKIEVKELFVGLPRVFRFERNGMLVSFGLIPLIGAVEPKDLENFDDINVLKRLIIALSGPIISLVLGVFLIFLSYLLSNTDMFMSFRNIDMSACNTESYGWLAVLFQKMIELQQFSGFLFVTGILSIAISIINIIPIPPLDGGKALLNLIELGFGKVLVHRIRYLVYFISILLLIYVVFTAISDIATSVSTVAAGGC